MPASRATPNRPGRVRTLALSGVGTACAAALLATSPAHAAFTPATPIGATSNTASSLATVASIDGSATLAYAQSGTVFAATKQPGAAFAAPEALGSGTGGVKLIAAPDGRTVASWIDGSNAWVAFRDAGTAFFHAPILIVGSPLVDVALAANGRAYIATATGSSVVLLTAAPGTRTLTTAATLTHTGTVSSAGVAADQAGAAWVVATTKSGGASSTTARRWAPGAPLGAAIALDAAADAPSNTPGIPGTSSAFGSVSAIPGTSPAFLWTRSSSSGFFSSSQIMRATPPSTALTGLDPRSAPSTTTRTPPSVAVDPSGAATVAWATRLFVSSELQLMRRSAAGVWIDAPVDTTLLAGNPTVTPVAVAPTGGDARLTYSMDGVIRSTTVDSATATANPGAVTVEALPTGATVEALTAFGTGAGDSGAAWIRFVAGVGTVVTALDDVTPPTLVIAPEPPVTTEGLEHAFVATAADRWTPTTITWDFGDGTTATGASVKHRFASPGDKTVVATARDQAGNETTQTITRRVGVAPDPLSITPTSTPPAGTPPVVVAPPAAVTLSALKLSRTRFAVSKGKPSRSKGTTVTFSLSAPTPTVELRVSVRTSGYRSGSDCQARKPKGTAKPKRCRFDKPLGLAGTVVGVTGANTFAFSGKAAGKFLKPGDYTLSAAPTQTNPPTSHGANQASVRFTVRKPG